MDEFDIYIRCFAGPSAEAAQSGLQRAFGLDARRAREFVQSLPRVAKRHVSAAHVARYERVLQQLGAEYELRRSAIRPQPIIAVVGGAQRGAGADPQQHGSTLTLTLAPPPPAWVAGPNAGGSASARPPPHGSQFARTIVDDRPPYGVTVDAEERATSESQPAPLASPELASSPFEVERGPSALPPSHGTWREGAPAPNASPRAPIGATAPRPSAWPPRPAAAGSPPSDFLDADRIRDPLPAATAYGADAWSALEPIQPAAPVHAAGGWAALQPSAPAAANASPGRASSAAPASGELPPPWQVPGLQLHGRPEWLVDRQPYSQAPALVAPAGSAPGLAGERGAPAPGSVAPPPAWQAPFAAPAVADANAGPPGRPTGRVNTVGMYSRPEPSAEVDDESPALLRFALRAGLGLSLFVILTTVRHCRVFDSGIEDALAGWGEQPGQELTGGARGAVPAAGGYGPPAFDWMESELHQFSSGDKDRARLVARRYKKAGAVQVYVGSIVQSGPIHFAGELIVELPTDPVARKAVLAEHQRVLEASFGGFAPAASDPGGPVLRVTL